MTRPIYAFECTDCGGVWLDDLNPAGRHQAAGSVATSPLRGPSIWSHATPLVPAAIRRERLCCHGSCRGF
jgi:hypothetical protein